MSITPVPLNEPFFDSAFEVGQLHDPTIPDQARADPSRNGVSGGQRTRSGSVLRPSDSPASRALPTRRSRSVRAKKPSSRRIAGASRLSTSASPPAGPRNRNDADGLWPDRRSSFHKIDVSGCRAHLADSQRIAVDINPGGRDAYRFRHSGHPGCVSRTSKLPVQTPGSASTWDTAAPLTSGRPGTGRPKGRQRGSADEDPDRRWSHQECESPDCIRLRVARLGPPPPRARPAQA